MPYLNIVIANADENTELDAMVALDNAGLDVEKSWLGDRKPRRPHRAWKWAATTAFLAGFAAQITWIWTDVVEWGWTGVATLVLATVLAIIATPSPSDPTKEAP